MSRTIAGKCGENSSGARILPLLILALSLLGAAKPALSEPGLELDERITLPAVSGRIDHMAVDLARKRLFVAELGNGSLDVVDLAAGRPIARLSGLAEPQGVGYAPADILVVANGGDGTVRFFQGGGLTPAGVLALGSDADDVRIDSRNGTFVIGYGMGALAFIDPLRPAKIGEARLAEHPEGFAIDGRRGRVFVNLPDAGAIAVLDLASMRQIATWRLPQLQANFPMALDASGAILATVFRRPPRLVLINARIGAPTARLDTCGDADDVFFDTKRQRIYVTCGAGFVDVFAAGPTGAYARLSRIATAAGARTSLFVPELDRLFVAARGQPGSEAAILVMRPVP